MASAPVGVSAFGNFTRRRTGPRPTYGTRSALRGHRHRHRRTPLSRERIVEGTVHRPVTTQEGPRAVRRDGFRAATVVPDPESFSSLHLQLEALNIFPPKSIPTAHFNHHSESAYSLWIATGSRGRERERKGRQESSFCWQFPRDCYLVRSEYFESILYCTIYR